MDHQKITFLLQKVGQGDKGSESQLLDLVYSELHRLASSYMRRERKDHTLQPSALVDEAYVKVRWQEIHGEDEILLFDKKP